MSILTESLFTKVMFPSHSDGLYNNIDFSCEYEGRLQLFYKVSRNISYEEFMKILNKSGSEEILDTIRLIFHLRDCRGGKGERLLGRYAFQWLSIHYPKYMLKYMHKIPSYGRWDDLFYLFPNVILTSNPENYCTSNIDSMMIQQIEQQAVQLIGDQLKKDIQSTHHISICSKWVPSENTKLDIQYNIRQTLCKYLQCSKKQLRKKYITPLRKRLHLIENDLCRKQYPNINFNSIPSYAILKYKKSFEKNTKLLYEKHVQTNYINMNTLYPYDIIKQYNLSNLPTHPDISIEKQWSIFIHRNQFDCFKQTVPIVDVSVHMYTKPLLKAYSIALLMLQCSISPFKDLIIECNDTLQCRYIPESYQLLDVLKQIPSSQTVSTSFNILKCFELFLEKANEHHLSERQIPNQLIFLSTMKGLQAVAKDLQKKTLMQSIDDKYKEAGFIRPRLIFFNVGGGPKRFPVLSNESNVALVSGYSHSIFKTLHYNVQDIFNPITTMKKILESSRYVL